MAAVLVALRLAKKERERYKKEGKLPPSKLEVKLEEMRRIGRLTQDQAPLLVVKVQVHTATLVHSLETSQLQVRLQVADKTVFTSQTVEPRRPSGLYRAVGRVSRALRCASWESSIPAPAAVEEEGLRIPLDIAGDFCYSEHKTLVFELLERRVLLPMQVKGIGSFQLSEAALDEALETRKDSKKAAKRASKPKAKKLTKQNTRYEETPEIQIYSGKKEILGNLRVTIHFEMTTVAERARQEAGEELVPFAAESSPLRDFATDSETDTATPATPGFLQPQAVASVRSGGSPRPAAKSERMAETRDLVDRMLVLRRSDRFEKWMDVFEIFDLEEYVDLKLLESKKRAIALRLHPDKVDDEMADFCGGRDRVYEAYYFLDEAVSDMLAATVSPRIRGLGCRGRSPFFCSF
ncbi:ANKRD17, partial [Symbiodinium sp. KB8]